MDYIIDLLTHSNDDTFIVVVWSFQFTCQYYFLTSLFPAVDEISHWKVGSYQFRYGVQDDEVGGYTIYCNVFSYHHGQLIIKSNNLYGCFC